MPGAVHSPIKPSPWVGSASPRTEAAAAAAAATGAEGDGGEQAEAEGEQQWARDGAPSPGNEHSPHWTSQKGWRRNDVAAGCRRLSVFVGTWNLAGTLLPNPARTIALR